jgi:dTMP kinase
MPDMTVVLDLPVAEALERSAGSRDRIEAEGRAFLERVADGYRELAAVYPGRIVVVDAAAPADEVASAILERVVAHLEPASRPGWGTRGPTVDAR